MKIVSQMVFPTFLSLSDSFTFVLRARLFSKAINVLLSFQLSIITKGCIETLNPIKQHLTEIGF